MIKIQLEHHDKKLHIRKNIKEETDPDKIRALYKEYAKLNKIERDVLIPLIEHLRRPDKYHLLVEKPKLEIINNKCDNIIKEGVTYAPGRYTITIT